MSTDSSFEFYDENALLDRLSKGLKKRSQEVIFLVGSPLSAPTQQGVPGVPGVSAIIDLIRQEFQDDPSQLEAFNTELNRTGANLYQAAFSFLQGRRGQQTANEIVRSAVLAARSDRQYSSHSVLSDDQCRTLELDAANWSLTPGITSLGTLLTAYPERFGRSLLTTNFDPLLEVSIRRAGGRVVRINLLADGNLSQIHSEDCQVIHLHGYWYGSDTLHTNRQLVRPRPHLKDSLSYLLRNKLFVVCAYGGWDDVFAEALMNVVRDETANPDIIWTFQSHTPELAPALRTRIAPGLDRGRITLYSGIDCHRLFPLLCDIWANLEASHARDAITQSNPVRVENDVREQLLAQSRLATSSEPFVLEGDLEDRPPLADIWVGREQELRLIETSSAKVVFVTGIGGQGKSTLVARYFNDCLAVTKKFSLLVWRDCKEESERFENQLASIILHLSAGTIKSGDLANLDPPSLIDLFTSLIKDLKLLLVFDNADHYIDLDAQRLSGSAELLMKHLLESDLDCRVVFTCRPTIIDDNPMVLSQRLEGLDLSSIVGLFSQRGAHSTREEIESAYQLTNGHPFWLDLLAIQIAKLGPPASLKQLLDQTRPGEGPSPSDTLNSLWQQLHDRDRTVLRAMAETLKPETEVDLGNYLSAHLNFNKLEKALRALRALNLVVVKRRGKQPDLLELHPLVRKFVRDRFGPDERRSFIDTVIRGYQRYISKYKLKLKQTLPLSVLQYWTESAELDIRAGYISEAILILDEVSPAFSSSAYPGEFCRVVRLLLSSVDWPVECTKYKQFDSVFFEYLELLAFLGENTEVDALLDEYAKTVPNHDSRFIRYCGVRCAVLWIRRDYEKALHWGRRGRELQEASGVDTKYDIRHQVALAERDAGRPEVALSVFLAGRTLEQVLDPNAVDEVGGGPFYGNIGRCLHFMGQVESALVCYQKSAILVEKDLQNRHVRNQAYIRSWIGELLGARKQFRLAEVFFRAAYKKWVQISPARAAEARSLAEHNGGMRHDHAEADGNSEAICLEWISGRSVDAEYS